MTISAKNAAILGQEQYVQSAGLSITEASVENVEEAIEEISVEICSKCHPFYTGKQKLVDTGGRVDKFNKRYGL